MTYKIELQSKTEMAMGAAFFFGDFKIDGEFVPENFDRWFLSDKFDSKGEMAAFAKFSKDDNREMWFQAIILNEKSPHLLYSKKTKGLPKSVHLSLEPLQVEIDYWTLEDGDQKVLLHQFSEGPLPS